jgi:predicted RNA binding protein YcfA (HicA-like mRNA interferase family)
MQLPRNVSGDRLVKGLRRVGYKVTRQRGDHVYLTTHQNSEHHVAIPLHNPVRVGTLAAILDSVAAQLQTDREDLLRSMKML